MNLPTMKQIKKYPLGYFVIALNVILFFILSAFTQGLSNSNTIYTALTLNSLENPTSLILNYFMHGGILHLAMNMFFVYQVAKMFESIYTRKEQIYIYFGFGLAISLICFAWIYLLGDPITVIGYSGVCFVLFGAILRDMDKKSLKINLGIMIGFHVLIIVMGLNIFWQGHLVGLLLGFGYSHFRFLKTLKKATLSDDEFDDFFSNDRKKDLSETHSPRKH
jgi:rhomboid protease GluP